MTARTHEPEFYCHICLEKDGGAVLTEATTTRRVPYRSWYRNIPVCADCGSQHDNRAEREGLARVNG